MSPRINRKISAAASPSMGSRRSDGSMTHDHSTQRFQNGSHRLCAAMGLVVLLTAPLMAQQAAQQDASSLTPDQRRMAMLEGEIKSLQQQLAAKAPQLSPDEQLKKMQQSYTTLFAQLKERVQPGCKSAGGTLSIALTATGSVASLTCVLK